MYLDMYGNFAADRIKCLKCNILFSTWPIGFFCVRENSEGGELSILLSK